MDKHLRPCIAELVGTFFLVFVGAGAICTDELLRQNGQSGAGLIGIAIAHGLALAVGITAAAAVSGGHLNPAVTITLWVYKKIDGDQAFFYVIFQLLGALVAGALLTVIFGALTPSLGTPHMNLAKLSSASGLRLMVLGIAIEIIMTFLLVMAVFATAIDPRAPKIGGFGVGLILTGCIFVGGPLTGAALNPARAFGTGAWEGAITGFSAMSDQLVYWIGPIIGGILAGGIYLNYMAPEEKKA
jgi:aquaporin Z